MSIYTIVDHLIYIFIKQPMKHQQNGRPLVGLKQPSNDLHDVCA